MSRRPPIRRAGAAVAPRAGSRARLAAAAIACLAAVAAMPPQCRALRRAAEAAAAPTAPAARAIDHRIGRGESFGAILAAHGVPGPEAARWHAALRPLADLSRIEAGRVLHLTIDPSGRLSGLHYTVRRGRTVVAALVAGEITAAIEREPIAVRAVGVRATVRTTLVEAGRRAGLPDEVIRRTVDLLGGSRSPGADAARGDDLRVLYEERLGADGRRLAPGRILAVEYRGRGGSADAYLYAVEGDAPVYVDGAGRLLDASRLRLPLEFSRISSAFSDARMHPILKRERAHRGVDFAAPLGTPVRAAAAGVVRFAGVQGGFGNHVEVDHGADFVSAYSHLRRIAPRVRAGARVARGQLLGWVGQTGLATGPHLHFAVFDRGEYVDPLRLDLLPRRQVVDRRRFERLRGALLARLRAIPRPDPAAPNAPEIGLPPLAQVGRAGRISLTF